MAIGGIRRVNRWLRELHIFDQRSHEKRLPADVFRLNKTGIAAPAFVGD
jgi:hypothetical protein